MFASSGRLDAAQYHLQEAVRIEPTNARLHLELAGLLTNQGHIHEATGHLEQKRRELRPNWPDLAEQALQALRLQNKKTR